MRGILKDLTFGRNGEQIITLAVVGDFRAEFDRLKDGEVRVEIKKWRNTRSLDANAYFHVLVNQIAAAQNLGDDEVKKRLVLQYGTLAKDANGMTMAAKLPLSVETDLIYPYMKWYKTVNEGGVDLGCYMFYKRTHTMDSKEMARLIDGTIYEAEELGIDTMSEQFRSLLESAE